MTLMLAAAARSPSAAPLFHIGAVEGWVEKSELSPALLQEPHDAPIYFLHVSYQDRIADDKIDHYVRRVYQINDASKIEDHARSMHDFAPESETITFHRCVIHRAGNTIDCLNPDRIRTLQRDTGLENHCVSDKLTLELLIDDLRVGDVVDIEATQTEYAGAHMLHGKFYLSSARLSWGVPIKALTHRYVNHSSQSITLQHLDTDNEVNKVWELTAGNSYVHSATDIESMQFIDDLPYWHWPDYLLATTTTSWSNVSSYIFVQNQQKKILSTNIDESLLQEIDGVDWQQTNKANITAIVRFVQESIRYRAESNGIHTHTPKSVSETLRRRTGDCKDKSAVLVVLLEKIGVHASLALVNTSIREDIKTVQPSAYWFNHMVVHFVFNNRSYVVDPTMQKQGGDIDTQARLNFGVCLPITQDGSELVAVDYDKEPLLREENVEIDLRFPELNQCTVSIERVYYQEKADNVRYQVASHEKSAFEEHFLNVAQELLNLELIILEPNRIVSDDKHKNRITTTELYQIQGDIKSHEDATLSFNSDAHNDFIMPKRNTHPVATAQPGRYRHSVQVHYGDMPSTINEQFELNNNWFEYSDTMKNCGASVVCTTEFASLSNSIAAKDVADCREAVDQLQKRSRTNLPLKLFLENTEANVADHQWYLYPIMYWFILTATKLLGLWGHPVVMAGLVVMAITYVGYMMHRRRWFLFKK